MDKRKNERMGVKSVDSPERMAGARCSHNEERISDRRLYLAVKRAQDVVLSIFALVVLAPFLLLIALIIVMDDPRGGPIFAHQRVGKGGRPFRMYKFRTMCVDAEERRAELLPYNEMDGPAFKIKKDPRITRVGAVLRRSSLDELPQLINIIRGEMSIVGPRPALPEEVAQYTSHQLRRLEATPGLTCFWQVHPNRYQLTMDQWAELDIHYIQEQSWLLDWKLIAQTVGALARRDGE